MLERHMDLYATFGLFAERRPFQNQPRQFRPIAWGDTDGTKPCIGPVAGLAQLASRSLGSLRVNHEKLHEIRANNAGDPRRIDRFCRSLVRRGGKRRWEPKQLPCAGYMHRQPSAVVRIHEELNLTL